MRYGKGHKESSTARILKVAAKQFRQDGIAAVGLAGVMKAADLTIGAFYSHFKSKEDLVRTVVTNILDTREGELRDEIARGLTLEDVIRDYLSSKHRDHSDMGCPISTLAPEIARHSVATRRMVTLRVLSLIELFKNQIPAKNERVLRAKAFAIYSQLVGTLQLARMAVERELSDEILHSGIDAALGILKKA